MTAEQMAQLFHETYEDLAPLYGYKTRKATRKPWDELPSNNKRLMVGTCEVIIHILDREL